MSDPENIWGSSRFFIKQVKKAKQGGNWKQWTLMTRQKFIKNCKNFSFFFCTRGPDLHFLCVSEYHVLKKKRRHNCQNQQTLLNYTICISWIWESIIRFISESTSQNLEYGSKTLLVILMNVWNSKLFNWWMTLSCMVPNLTKNQCSL